MLLVDGIYINSGGGKILLDYLISHLDYRKSDVFFLLDKRLEGKEFYRTLPNVKFEHSSILRRHIFYLQYSQRFNKVLCFGNIPPTVSVDCEVFTFFQNVLLLRPRGVFDRGYVKYLFLLYFSKNTDKWIVQTEVVKRELSISISSSNKILVLPFYKDLFSGNQGIRVSQQTVNFIYVSSGEPHKNHLRLLSAFKRLSRIYPECTLTLTVDNKYTQLVEIIDKYRNDGISINNIGFIDSIPSLYREVDVCVYPSLAESFGLGLLEAAQSRLPIICSNLPFALEVIEPVRTFDPYCEDSILSCMLDFRSYLFKVSKIKSTNHISEVISLIS